MKKTLFSMPSARTLFAACALVVGAAMLVSCTALPDPADTRDAFTEITADPTPPEPDSPYDAELHPEPIVDPLECSEYLVVTARGTGEPKRKQLLGPVARAISEARPDNVQRLDLDYPADTDVNIGGEIGARLLIDTLNVQTEACPDQQFVLLGYSQGALVIGDAIASPEYRLVGSHVGELTEEATDRVRAIVLYGNPRFVGSEPYDEGSFLESVNGILPRPPGSLDLFTDRLRDYCVARDFVCQTTLDLDEEGHVAYYENGMQQDGAAFVITQLDPIVDTGKSGDPASPDAKDDAASEEDTAASN